MVGLLIIAHDALGEALLRAATGTLGFCPLPAASLQVVRDCDPDQLDGRARHLVEELDEGEGVLILTDLFGSTPSNIACRLLEPGRVNVVSGINLPMLIRVMNYPQLALEELTAKATSAGTDGVMRCQ